MSESVSGNSSTSKSLMFMMIALFIGIAILLGGGLFLAGRVIRSAGLSASSSKDTVRLPMGNLRVEQPGKTGPGLPVYPNSSMEMPGENSLADAVKDVKANMSSTTYITSDTRGTVEQWYLQHLGQEYVRHEAGEKPFPEILTLARVKEDSVSFIAERGQQVRIVSLSEADGKTTISLLHLEKTTPPQN
jgi:hypothetical protein